MHDLEASLHEAMAETEGFSSDDMEFDEQYKEDLENATLEVVDVDSNASNYKDSDIGVDYVYVRNRHYALIKSLEKMLGKSEVIASTTTSDKAFETYNRIANTLRYSLKDMLSLNSTYTRVTADKGDKKETNGDEESETENRNIFEWLEEEREAAGSKLGSVE